MTRDTATVEKKPFLLNENITIYRQSFLTPFIAADGADKRG